MARDLSGTQLQEADFTQPLGVEHIILSSGRLKNVNEFKFPTSLLELDFKGNAIQSIAPGVIPNSVTTLYLGENSLLSASNIALPDGLSSLSLTKNKLSTIDFAMPSGLSTLMLTGNPLRSLENFTMPESLTEFMCANCGVQSFRGVQLPPQLNTLNVVALHPSMETLMQICLLNSELSGSTITRFELRTSDINVFKAMPQFTATIEQLTCDDPEADLEQVRPGGSVCVISDARFAARYPQRLPSTQVPSRTPRPTSPPDVLTSPQTIESAPQPESSSSVSSPASSPNSTLITIISAVTGVVLLVVAAIGYRVFYRPCQQSHSGHTSPDNSKYMDAGMAPTLELHGQSYKSTPSTSSQEYLSNDVRNDPELIPFRIDQDEIQILRLIAKGGYGIIHLGRVRGHDVAVKQLLPERCREMGLIRSFMDEIRMCARLEHPKVVTFVGLCWTTLLDMAVLTEYMCGGDLGVALYNEKHNDPDPYYWFEPTATLKPKNLVALDVVEALVYLHSFSNPIIHRDLKSKNVLLSGDGEAKLSDFGISREVPLDATMTGEVGTVAWIAPEILQGERYSWKADIYSFGVLLVELDTCRHPYSAELMRASGTSQTNARIALLVSTGKLVPSVSAACPEGIRDLTMRCLTFNPDERPSALEIHYALRKIQARGSQSGQLV